MVANNDSENQDSSARIDVGTVVTAWAGYELAKTHPVATVVAGAALGARSAAKVFLVTFFSLVAVFFILAGIAKLLGY